MQNSIQDLVKRLKEKLKGGATFNNPRLTNEANKFFGGRRGSGYYNPRDAYDALEAAANLLLLEEQATYLMGSPAREALDELRGFTQRLPTQADRTREQVEMQQFSTPSPLAYAAARMLAPQQGEVVLEPSAGTGSLALWPRAIGAKVICNEIAPRRKALLEMLGFETHSVDAELLDDLLPSEIKPAGILMNPPFSATNGRVARHDPVYGARHVETALRRLEKGGRLVAITSAAMAIGPSRFADWWRRVARAYNVRASVTIAGGEFAKSGTSVGAQLIVIDKDGPTPGNDWKKQLENIERGRFDSLEEAWEKLKGLANRAPREESPEEEAPAQVFAPYQVARLTGGRSHPAEIVEAASMAAVRPPIVTYRPTLPPWVVEEGALSDIQLERVIYAGQRHEQRLPDGARCGFFVGDGCVASGTRIYNPLTGEHVAIERLMEIGRPHYVLSLTRDGFKPRFAYAPFLKGVAKLYRVILESGRQVTVTDGHRFLTPNGWMKLADGLSVGDLIACAETGQSAGIEDDPCVHRGNGESSIRRPEDCLDRCSTYSHLDGERFLLVQDSALISLPSQDDVLGRIRLSSQKGDRGLSRVRIHHHQNTVHLSTQDFSPSAIRGHVLIAGQDVSSYFLWSAASRPSEPQSLWSKVSRLSIGGAALHQSIGRSDDCARQHHEIEPRTVLELLGQSELSFENRPQAHAYLCRPDIHWRSAPTLNYPEGEHGVYTCNHYSRWDRIRKVDFVEEAPYYDMYVPGPENYVAEGIVHHNTGLGKGRTLAAIVFDNWNKGRRRAVWFSVNNDLMEAAKRDLDDVGAGHIPIARINDYPANGEIGLRQGVIFSTYSSLISQSKDGRRRIDQIQRWLGREGVLVLDECVPGDTKIAMPNGERPIKDLKVGDLVLGYNHETGAIEPTPVLHLFRRESAEPLYQVHGAKMTSNHPVWTQERGYVRADNLTPFDNVGILERGDSHEGAVFHLRVVSPILHAEISSEQKTQRREAAFLQHILFREMADEPPRLCEVTYHRERTSVASRTPNQGARARRRPGEVESTSALTDIQPILLGDHPAQSSRSITGEKLRTSYGRQRQWTDRPTANAARLFGLDCGVYRSGQSLAAGPAKALQTGYSQSDRQNRHRGRWALSSYASRQRKRQEEGGLFTLAGVDSAQVSERGNPTRPQFRNGAHRGSHVVYNIETGTGNYFADSVLVHNCHKAKNALAGGLSEPTQTGQAVIDLQSPERNPDYRIVYSSATGATDVRHMVYMTRLGLWGPGTAFSGGFIQFLNEIEAGGVGAMELVSRDMKALGMYLSGSISFGTCPRSGKAVEYREVIHRLTPEQHEMYNRAAAAWQHVLKNIHEAVRVTGGSPRARSLALNKFWGDHQRFFRQIICAFKTPTVIAETKRALAKGKSVVISLIGTGEARTQDQVGRALEVGATLEDLDFTPREIIAQMIERGFPTTVYQDETDPDTGRTSWSVVNDEKGAPLQSREALRMKQELLDGLSALHLPENPLDQLVNAFGENAVAELTGRKRRLIRDPKTGKVVYKKRSLEGVPMDKVNVHEMSQFQGGKKRIAVISSAAGMGVSLHSSNRAANRQRREHIVLELSWSADQQMQFFGRTHRSDQAVPPEYVLVPTELGGERRFSSTIARRLGSLGALTKGDRGAANSADLAKYNFETAEGRAALTALLRGIMRGEDVPGLDDSRQALRDMGLLVKFPDGSEDIRREDETNVPRFLNRVLALDVSRQNAIFDHFTSIFERTVAAAKAGGTFDEGVTDVRAVAVRYARAPRVVATDEITGAETTHYVLEVDRKIKTLPLEAAEEERRDRSGVFMRHKKQGHVILACPSRYHTDVDTGATYRMFAISRPEGSRVSYMREAELEWKFRPVGTEEAREWWNKRHAELPEIETSQMHVVGGAILPLWQRVKTQQGSGLRIVRVTTDDGRRIVGAQIPEERVGPVLRALGISRNLKTPKEVFEAVWRNDEEVDLVTGVVIKRTSVHKEGRIEACDLQYFHYAALRQMGLIEERIDFRSRFFIPAEEEAGVAALMTLLKAYPQIKSEEEVEEEESSAPEDLRIETEAPPIDLSKWIIPGPDARPEPPAARPDEVARPTSPRVVEADSPRVMGVPKTATQQSLFDL